MSCFGVWWRLFGRVVYAEIAWNGLNGVNGVNGLNGHAFSNW